MRKSARRNEFAYYLEAARFICAVARCSSPNFLRATHVFRPLLPCIGSHLYAHGVHLWRAYAAEVVLGLQQEPVQKAEVNSVTVTWDMQQLRLQEQLC